MAEEFVAALLESTFPAKMEESEMKVCFRVVLASRLFKPVFCQVQILLNAIASVIELSKFHLRFRATLFRFVFQSSDLSLWIRRDGRWLCRSVFGVVAAQQEEEGRACDNHEYCDYSGSHPGPIGNYLRGISDTCKNVTLAAAR